MNRNKHSQETLDAWLALTQGQAPTGLTSDAVGLPVLSGSMLPDIPPQSTLLIRPARHRDCRIGDVAVFTDGSYRLVAHRLLLRFRLGPWVWFFQKGDNNPYGGWIDARRICGLAVRLEQPEAGSDPDSDQSVLYKPDRVGQSLQRHLRNLVLAWPRRVRDRLTGRA